MSDATVRPPLPRRRIRARTSPEDARVMGFALDAPIQPGRTMRLDAPGDDSPLSRALFDVAGVARIEVSGATIWIRKADGAEWSTLKPAVAGAIRGCLDTAETPLGTAGTPCPDAALMMAVEDLLTKQVNPGIASHGGHIAVERAEGGVVSLRMSGGCQGCAASSATLRQGVERILRAALPSIREIVDVTDHAAGTAPFHAQADGPSPLLHRPVPPGVIGRKDGQITVDPAYLAPRLGLEVEALRAGLRSGDVVGVTETGEGDDTGKSRIVLRNGARSWAAEVLADGTAREIPPPRSAEASARRERDLADRIRTALRHRPADDACIPYGALARSLGLWAPGSVARVTRALEATMREDAAAKRPFIAARAVSRGPAEMPGRGFFDLARALSRGPEDGESDRNFHTRELARLGRTRAEP